MPAAIEGSGGTGTAPDPTPLFDPRTFVDGVPHDLIAELRAHAPVHWIGEPELMGWEPGPGFWAVLTHELMNRVLRDPGTFSSHLGGTQIRDPKTAEMLMFVQRMMLNQDPPQHTRLRRLLMRSFTPSAVAELEATISDRARMLVDNVADRGRADFAKEVSAELPLLTLADIMGVPTEDRMLLFDWSNRVIGYQDAEYAVSDAFDPATGTEMARRSREVRAEIRPGSDGRMPDPRSREGLADMYAYALDLAEHKRANPGSDVVSILLAAPDDEGGITNEEFETMFFLFAVAGNETLRNGIPGGMWALLQHPDQLGKLLADPALLPGAIEEMLRFIPPVVHFRRTASRDVELGGCPIQAGDKVVVFHVAANRDPAVFAEPDHFDIERSPNDHLTFGAGPHFCLGAHLARRQMTAMFSEALSRLANLRLDPARPPQRLLSNFQHGFKHLPVIWDTPLTEEAQ
ncbi:cytochrome P450 [Candidatus Poriferisodalis sp.]|uniref:cytochrome P450 n=1 Tax=Candidatus Poriferisodalis sp. TaxID=3101277 RepID=UPI003B51F114